jgi:hypothetical protein
MNTRMLALQAANVGMGLSSNRKNRVLRAPATSDSGPALPFRKDRVLRVRATEMSAPLFLRLQPEFDQAANGF